MLNQITLIGRTTKEPESQYTPSGVALAKFTIAVDRFTKDATTGEKETDFIPVITWRKTAEFVSQFIGKGRLICVTGRLQIRSYVQQDGQKRWMTEVIAEHVQGLDRPKENPAADPRPMPRSEDMPEVDAEDVFADE